MKPHYITFGIVLLPVLILGCSGTDPGPSNAGKGGGGVTTVGGETGNANTSGLGGAATGGAATGGAATGGAATGGANKGGTSNVLGSTNPVAGSGQGGTVASGGTPTSGGATSKGGSSASGGAVSAGGTPAKGGATSLGGTASKGGTTSTGGTASSGGTTQVVSRCSGGVATGRVLECLARGVVVVNQGGGKAFVSWRLLGTEPADTGFNLYRQTGTAAAVKLNSAVLTAGTNYQDATANFTQATTYCIRPVNGGIERPQSSEDCYALPANAPAQDYISIPLKAAAGDAAVHLAWVGDLDGNGEFDIVADRISATNQPVVDAYRRDGTFLWRFDTGPNGADQDNIEGGASTMSNGMWDGLTVYDLDSDGKAEIAVKTAPGVIFGNGATKAGAGTTQSVSILEGTTGRELASAPLPTDYLADGNLQCQFNVGYLDGLKPSLITKCKNRVGSGGFNLMIVAYDYAAGKLSQRWKYLRGNQSGASDYHQQRIVDIDGDGRDEVADGGYVVDEYGKYLYGIPGAIHGDRFHIGDLDPARPGLEGFGIQQDNASGLLFYTYDAKTGAILRAHSGTVADMARGTAADVDPRHPGYEYWTFAGMFNIRETTAAAMVEDPNTPWPNFRIWWDGDALSEMLNQAYVAKWDYAAASPTRKGFTFKYNLPGTYSARDAVPFYGDILGDWREEVVLETADHSAINIVTTTYPSSIRLYTLAHNPEYRNGMATQGYRQSLMVDYYLGDGMVSPPAPAIHPAPRL